MNNDSQPKRSVFYYGWIIMVLAAIAMAATLPSRTQGLALITESLLADFSLTKIGFAQMNLVATLTATLFCWPCGWLIDRFGLRLVSGFTILLLGLVTTAMGYVQNSTELGIALVLARGFGQGALSVISISMVSKWFKRRLPMTMGFYSIIGIVLMAVAMGIAMNVLNKNGWRFTWHTIGYCLLITGVMTLVFTRDRRSYESAVEFAEADKVVEEGASLTDALLSPTFWAFALSISFFGMVSAGISLFNQDVLQARGFPKEIFQELLIFGMLIGLISNLITGFIAQRVSKSKLLTVAMLILAVTYASFPWVQTVTQAYLYTAFNAFGGGMLMVLFFSIWGAAFGGQKLGQIQGLAQGLTVVASALGPLSIAIVEDQSKSYDYYFFAAAIASFVFSVFAALIRVPAPSDFVSPGEIKDVAPATT